MVLGLGIVCACVVAARMRNQGHRVANQSTDVPSRDPGHTTLPLEKIEIAEKQCTADYAVATQSAEVPPMYAAASVQGHATTNPVDTWAPTSQI